MLQIVIPARIIEKRGSNPKIVWEEQVTKYVCDVCGKELEGGRNHGHVEGQATGKGSAKGNLTVQISVPVYEDICHSCAVQYVLEAFWRYYNQDVINSAEEGHRTFDKKAHSAESNCETGMTDSTANVPIDELRKRWDDIQKTGEMPSISAEPYVLPKVKPLEPYMGAKNTFIDGPTGEVETDGSGTE